MGGKPDMNTAKRPEQYAVEQAKAQLPITPENDEAMPANVIDLAEHGLQRRSEPLLAPDDFVDHSYSPLNEW